MTLWKLYVYSDTLKCQNYLGGFTNLLAAKATIRHFDATEYKIILDNDALRAANTFQELATAGNIIVNRLVTEGETEEGRGQPLF